MASVQERVERGELESLQRSIQLHLTVALRAMQMYTDLVESTDVPLERNVAAGDSSEARYYQRRGFVDVPRRITVTDVKSARTRLRRLGEEIAGFRRARRAT